MRLQRGLVFALGVSAVAGACATAGAGTGGPTAALPNVACPEGVTMAATPETNSAQVDLVRAQATGDTALYRQALNRSLQGIQTTPNNPQLYYLAGQAYAGAGDYAGADSVWARAATICPAFAAEIRPERERAWAQSYQRALDALTAGDTATAIASWEQSAMIFKERPDAVYNLAVLASERRDYDQAVARFEETLRSLDNQPAMDPADTTAATQAADMAEMRRNAFAGMLNVGAQRFSADDFAGAARVFERLTRLDPNSRDAWYNYALALYQQKQWPQLLPVAEKVVQIDPLNENANVLLFNAYKENKQNPRALEVLERIENMPVKVTQVQVRSENGRSTVTGTVEGNKARAGSPVRLEFTLFGGGQQLGTQTVTVNAPAAGATGQFELSLDNPVPVSGYRYRVAS